MSASVAYSQSAYSSLVAPKPAGCGPAIPGSLRATESFSRQPRSASQPSPVSSAPWTKTAVTAASVGSRVAAAHRASARSLIVVLGDDPGELHAGVDPELRVRMPQVC